MTFSGHCRANVRKLPEVHAIDKAWDLARRTGGGNASASAARACPLALSPRRLVAVTARRPHDSFRTARHLTRKLAQNADAKG
jgi:hypothetical protein